MIITPYAFPPFRRHEAKFYKPLFQFLLVIVTKNFAILKNWLPINYRFDIDLELPSPASYRRSLRNRDSNYSGVDIPNPSPCRGTFEPVQESISKTLSHREPLSHSFLRTKQSIHSWIF